MINSKTPSLAYVAPLTSGVPDGNTGRPSSIRTLPKKTCGEGVFAPPTSPSFWEAGGGDSRGGAAAAGAPGNDDSAAKPVKQASSSAVTMQTHWSEPGQHNQV